MLISNDIQGDHLGVLNIAGDNHESEAALHDRPGLRLWLIW